MHTYRKSNQGGSNYLYTVGYMHGSAEPGYRPEFDSLADFNEEWKAALYTSFLNGGHPPIGLLNELFPHANFG